MLELGPVTDSYEVVAQRTRPRVSNIDLSPAIIQDIWSYLTRLDRATNYHFTCKSLLTLSEPYDEPKMQFNIDSLGMKGLPSFTIWAPR